MPRRNETRTRRPEAQELFTDRVTEQERLKQLFDALCAERVDPTKLFLHFYGVGGVGKTTLKNRAIREWRRTPHAADAVELRFAECDVDAAEFTPDYGIMEFFSKRLRPSLKSAGFQLPLFDIYYCAWRGKSKPDEQMSRENVLADLLGEGERAADTAAPLVAWLGTLGNSFRGIDLVMKCATAIRDWHRNQRFVENFRDLNLESFSLKEFDEFAGDVMAADLREELAARPGRALCIVIDGFERIQSDDPRNDLQCELQDFCQHVLVAEPAPRCGFLVLGREKLRWRELYDGDLTDEETHWDKYITHSLLGDITTEDARDYLAKVIAWYRSPPAAGKEALTAELIEEHLEAILMAAEAEESSADRHFHPYSLDLAVQQIIDHAGAFRPEMLGRGSRDLQERFLRYMNDKRRAALQALAVALEFDQALFGHLVEKRIIIDYPLHGFADLVAPTYVSEDQVAPSTYRFHRKMQDALLANLKASEGGPQKLAVIVGVLQDYYRERLRATLRSDTLLAERAYDRAATILLEHGRSRRLEFDMLQTAFDALEAELDSDWKDKYFNLEGRIRVRTELVKLTEARRGAEHPEVAASLHTLARLHWFKGNSEAAERLNRRALAIREKVLGPEHADTAKSLHYLAVVLKKKGENAAAESLYRQALTIRERTLGENHPETAKTLNNLANLLKHDDAERQHRRALAIKEEALEPIDPSIAASLINLANLLSRMGERAESEILYRRALAIFEESLGPEHPDTAIALRALAKLLTDQGEHAAARPLLERALAIQEKVLGPEHPDTTTSLNNLAVLLRRQGDYSAARPLFERALAIRDKVLGPEHADIARTLNGLVLLLGRQGEYAAARPLLERALAIQEKVLGPEHPDTATSVNNLAVILMRQGDHTAARPLLERALAIREKVRGPEHPDTAASLNNLAGLLVREGEHAAAESLYRRALSIREQVFGLTHRSTVATREALSKCLEEMGRGDEARALGQSRRATDGDGPASTGG